MPDQLLVEVIVDSSQLSTTFDLLEKMGALDAQTAASFKKTNDELSKRASLTKNVTAENTKQVKTLTDLRKSVDSLAQAAIDGIQEGVTQAFADAGVTAEDFAAAVQKASKATTDQKKAADQNATAQKSLKQQYRELVAQLALLERQGQRNTEQYRELLATAGEISDAIGDANEAIARSGSDTRGLDNTIELAKGAAAAYGVFQGATALVGGENEALNETLVKVSSATAVLTGLQEISALVSKQQFESLSALVGAEKLATLQTNLQTGAESSNIVVKYLSIAAQKLLNAAIAANPLGLAIIAVGVLTAAYAIFSGGAREAAKAQADLNSALEAGNEYLNADLRGIESAKNKQIAAAKARGASILELTKIEAAAGNSRLQAIKDAQNANAKALADEKLVNNLSEEDYKKLIDNKASLDNQYTNERNDLEGKASEYRRLLYERDIQSYTAYQDAKVFQARKGSIAELQAQINAAKAARDEKLKLDVDATPGERAKVVAESNRQILELENQITIKRLENEKFLFEAKLATLREGSIEELQERAKIAAKAGEIELAALGISNEKAKALRAQQAQEQAEFTRQINDIRLQTELEGLQTRLAKVKEGGAAEFNLQLDILQKTYQQELNQKGISDEKKLLLEAQYLKQVADLTKANNQKITEQAINTKQAEINARLADLQMASTEDTNSDLIRLKQESIDEQAQLDIVAAENSITNERLKQARIKEILQKAAADKRTIDETAQIAEINYNLEITQLTLENEKKKLQAVVDSPLAGANARAKASAKIKDITKSENDAELAALNELHDKKLISEKEYQARLLQLQGKALDATLQKQKEHEELIKQIRTAGLDVLQQVSDTYFEVDKNKRDAALQAQLSALEAVKNQELNNADLTAQQKADTERRYAEKERQLKSQAAKKDREAAISQAITNGLLAVTKALASVAPPFNFIAAAAASAAALIQVAKIKSVPLPQYRKGTRSAKGGDSIVGEEGIELVYDPIAKRYQVVGGKGPEVVNLPSGAKVYNYYETMKIAGRLNTNPKRDINGILMGNMPSVEPEILRYKSNSTSLDYKALAKEIAAAMPKPADPVVNSIVMDERGFTKSILRRGSRQRILNDYHKFSK